MNDIVGQLGPAPWLLIAGVAADLAFGDPVYRWHPVRLIGRMLSWTEGRLRAAGADGYAGGILLFVILATVSVTILAGVVAAALAAPAPIVWLVHAAVIYVLLALGDLLRHVWRIESAVRRGDLAAARVAVAALVGRDTDRMDAAGCRRAAVESLSENLTDGFVSPVLWYTLAGLPGLVLFKVVSTMDSMVGYKTPKYLQFGWCGARLDDLMNYVPARFTWLALSVVALVLPRCSGRKAWRVGLQQHGVLLGPNAGWSEAAIAGALERRIVGPIWLKGVQVTDRWVGEPGDPPLESADDVSRSMRLTLATGLAVVAIAALLLVALD